MKLVLIVIDAFRYDYLSSKNTPFLFDCAKKGFYVKHIIPSAGFCERSEIFTGKSPSESGFFTAIGYSPDKSEYKDKFFLKILSKIDGLLNFNLKLKNRFRKYILLIFSNYFTNKKLQPYNIPFNFLYDFSLTEDEFAFDAENNANKENLLYKLKSKKKSYSLDCFTSLGAPSNGNDLDRINLAVEKIKDKKITFLPIYIGEIDAMGHKFGPLSEKNNIILKDLDKKLEIGIQKIINVDPNTQFLFLGDHGMTKVKKHINVEYIISKIAKSLDVKIEQDFIYFLDSTILRLWFFKKDLKNDFLSKISSNEELSKFGKIIDDNMRHEFMLPVNDRRYGDIAWWANPGVLIFPDFFHITNIYKGMHGYNPNDLSTHGTCFAYGNSIEKKYQESLHLNKVYDLIKQILKL